jgi:hypothetical protein
MRTGSHVYFCFVVIIFIMTFGGIAGSGLAGGLGSYGIQALNILQILLGIDPKLRETAPFADVVRHANHRREHKTPDLKIRLPAHLAPRGMRNLRPLTFGTPRRILHKRSLRRDPE